MTWKSSIENAQKPTMPKSEPVMNGQEKLTNGNELRWVVGSNEKGPARIYDSRSKVVFAGTYETAVRWLSARGNSPA